MRNQSSPQWLQTLNINNNSPLSPFLHTHWPKPIHLPEKAITTTARESSLPTWALWSALDPVSLSGQVSCQFKLPQRHTQTSYLHHLLYFWKDLPRGDLDQSPDQYCPTTCSSVYHHYKVSSANGPPSAAWLTRHPKEFTSEPLEAREKVQSFPWLSIRPPEHRTFGVSHI